jgi:hypothetical protein
MTNDELKAYLIGFDPAGIEDGPHYRVGPNWVFPNAFDLDLYNPVEKRWTATSYSTDRTVLEQQGIEWETFVNSNLSLLRGGRR